MNTEYLDIAPTTDDLWFKMASMTNNVEVLVCPYIDRDSIYLKHSSGLDFINFHNYKKNFIKRIYNKTIGKVLDYFGIARTKNDLAWKQIMKFEATKDLV